MSKITSKVPVSAIILTFNEENYIQDCLQSLTWCDQICVVDSFSTDRTLEIAQEYTTNIAQHPFTGFAKQRNWALDNLDISGEWILMIDADERVPEDLKNEIINILKRNDESFEGYFIRRDQFYWGKHLRYGGASDAYCFRLYKKGVVRYPDKPVHEDYVFSKKPGFLRNRLKHIVIENLTDYIDKVNKYSSLEVQRMFATGEDLYSTVYRSYTWKNQVLKYIFKFLPFKSCFKFFYHYIILQGFRDRYEGFLYAVLESFYVFISYAKLWELKKGIVKPDNFYDKG